MKSFRDSGLARRSSIGDAGFTMVEIVLALTLLVMIVGVAYSALSQIMRGKKLLDDSRDISLLASSVLTRMSRELQLAYAGAPLLQDEEANEEQLSSRTFLLGTPERLKEGRGDSVTFVALEGGQYLPDGGTHSGLVQITYRVEEPPERSETEPATYYLVRDEIPYIRPIKDAMKKRMTFPVTQELVNLKIQYYDPDEEEWVDKWGTRTRVRLPIMARITLRLRSPRGKVQTYATAVALRSLD